MTRTTIVLALGVTLLLAAASPSRAQRSLTIASFEAGVTVDRDGGIEVVETIGARFTGSWNGLYRSIPVEYVTPQQLNYSLRLTIDAVTDETGSALRYESSRERHHRKLKVWVPDARDAVRTIVIRYRVAKALRFFDDYDELYWNVTGQEWEVPIERAEATITLPEGVENVRAVAFTGGYGSREEAASIDNAGTTVRVRTSQPLAFREGLTVGLAWNPGVVHRPTSIERTAGFARSNLLLIVPLVALGIMWRVWSTRGRDPKRRPIVPRYEPPEGLTPGELGTIADDSPDVRDVTATLVDLAVRGLVRIEEWDDTFLFGLFTTHDYRMVLLVAPVGWSGLRSHERQVLEGVFDLGGGRAAEEAGVGTTVKLSDLQNTFYKKMEKIRAGLKDGLVRKGIYVRRPDRVRTRYVAGGVIAGVAVTVGGVFLSQLYGLAVLTAILAGGATALVVVGFGWFMPARTPAGVRVLEEVLGFEEFLRRVEKDHFERVIKTPEMFEQYLAFAMALGVDKQWARAFEGIVTEPPSWYRGGSGSGFHPAIFVGSMGKLSHAAGVAMSSSPRSSGGSSFGGGGGGFSGGGFGGGGGGGF